jgi:hypothetical protein
MAPKAGGSGPPQIDVYLKKKKEERSNRLSFNRYNSILPPFARAHAPKYANYLVKIGIPPVIIFSLPASNEIECTVVIKLKASLIFVENGSTSSSSTHVPNYIR